MIKIYGVEFKDVYEVEIEAFDMKETVEIPAQSADEARAIGRGYNGYEHRVYSVKGKFFDYPGKDQLPSLTRAALARVRA